MNLDEVIAQTPVLREVDDDRVQFYFQNREIIETWASLRREAAATLGDSLSDLVEPLQEDLEGLGEHDIQVTVGESRGRRSVAITRLAWHRSNAGSPVQVALEAEPHVIGTLGAIQVYPCVRAKQGHPHSDLYRDRLNALSSPLRTAMGRGWKPTLPRFVVWKYIDASAGLEDVTAILMRARAELLALWVVAAPLVDAAMAEDEPGLDVRAGVEPT